MGTNRRDFLKVAGAAGCATLLGPLGKALAEEDPSHPVEFYGAIVDTTRCIGCRTCEASCNTINKLPAPEVPFDNLDVFEKKRTTGIGAYTVVNRYQTDKGEIFVKTQCMHCNQPGCVSACLVKAMEKKAQGPVTWNKNCMGCRYCMVACPFDIPKFEYDSPAPRIQKCTFCWDERTSKGATPACIENCPAEALTFGTRRELVEEANRRIYENPDSYLHQIYGEFEVGGTAWLYLSAVPFEQIGFRTNLETTSYPKLTKGFLTSIAMIDLIIPPLLLGINYITKREDEVRSKGGERT